MVFLLEQGLPNRTRPLRGRSISHLWNRQEDLFVDRTFNELTINRTICEAHVVGLDHS